VENKMLKMYVKCMMVWNSLKESKKGQGMVEYGLIIGFIAVVVIGLLVTLGGQVKAFFQTIVTSLGG
jgi:pilus assembly protein Flp/PilA